MVVVKGQTGVCAPRRQEKAAMVLGMESRRRGQVEEAVLTFTTILEKKAGNSKRERTWGCALEGARGGSPYRLDVAVQETHRVDGLNGLQDLLAQPQRSAQREGASRLAAAQVG